MSDHLICLKVRRKFYEELLENPGNDALATGDGRLSGDNLMTMSTKPFCSWCGARLFIPKFIEHIYLQFSSVMPLPY